MLEQKQDNSVVPVEGDLVALRSSAEPLNVLPLGAGIVVKCSEDFFPGVWWWILIDSNIIKVHVSCVKIIKSCSEI